MIGFTLRRSGELVLGKKPHGAEVGYLWKTMRGDYCGFDRLLQRSTGAYATKAACRAALERSVSGSIATVAAAIANREAV